MYTLAVTWISVVVYTRDKDKRREGIFFLHNLLLADSARSTILTFLSPFPQLGSRLFAVRKGSCSRYRFLQILYFALTKCLDATNAEKNVLVDSSSSNEMLLRWEGQEQKKMRSNIWKIRKEWKRKARDISLFKIQKAKGCSVAGPSCYYSPTFPVALGKKPQCFNWQHLELRRI